MFKRFAKVLLLATSMAYIPSHAANTSTGLTALQFAESVEEQFLPPDLAFGLQMMPVGVNNVFNAQFKVASGYYLYKSRIKFVLPPSSAVTLKSMILPQGEIKNDPNFGEMEVYHHDFNGQIHLSDVNLREVELEATYQGCSEKGLCYAPIKKVFNLTLADSQIASKNAISLSDDANATVSSNDSQAANLLKSGRWWLIILGFFTAGLLLAFTPCVFPMIPILSSIIIGKNAHNSRLQAFNLSLAYTLGMCVTYTLAGIAAGLSGQMLSSALQTPWALGFGALVFVLLSLSMFGFYELKLPNTLENKFLNWNQRFKGGGYFSDFSMGALSALIISPCVAAPLAGALLYISKTHDVVLGGVALFSLSLGMGAPLLAIGVSAGTLLPKAGPWMNAVRNVFGVLMLGVAIWLISPVIPVSVQMVLWAALLIIPAILMRAIDPLPVEAKPILRFWKGVALMMLITGLAMLIGALSEAKSPLQPLSGILEKSNAAKAGASLSFTRIKNIAELNAQLSAAKGRPVMLDFYADWCVSCKELEYFTFSNPQVKAALNNSNTLLLQADVTANSDEDKALLQHFSLFGPPAILFFNGQGEQLTPSVTGYQDAQAFLTTLQQRKLCETSTTQC